VIRGSAADPAAIAIALRDLLSSPGYRSAAAELAARNAQAPTPAALVNDLVALVERASHRADSQPVGGQPQAAVASLTS